MKIHKVVLTIIDFDEVGADGVKEVIENARYPNRCISPHVRSVETRDIGEWSDDHLLNKRDTAEAEIKRLFASLSCRDCKRYVADITTMPDCDYVACDEYGIANPSDAESCTYFEPTL